MTQGLDNGGDEDGIVQNVANECSAKQISALFSAAAAIEDINGGTVQKVTDACLPVVPELQMGGVHLCTIEHHYHRNFRRKRGGWCTRRKPKSMSSQNCSGHVRSLCFHRVLPGSFLRIASRNLNCSTFGQLLPPDNLMILTATVLLMGKENEESKKRRSNRSTNVRRNTTPV